MVYSLPKHKVFEGFSSTLVEKTTVKDGKRIKSIEKPAAASTSLPTPTTVKNTTRTSSAPRKTPSVRKPRARTNSTEKKVSKEPTKSKEKTKSNADRPRAASKVDPVPIMEPKKPKKPPVIKLSSAFKAKGTTDEEKDAEEHALEAQRIFAERARKKRLQTISASPEKQIKRKEVREVSPVREKSLKKPKTPKELPLERKRELQGAPRKKSRNRDEHKQRYSSLSPPRSVTGKRARPRTSEPPRKRRRPMPEPSSEEDEELDDFIVSDEEEERFAAPSFRRPGRRERDPYRGRSRRDYYSDDSPDMESSFLDIEEEERQRFGFLFFFISHLLSPSTVMKLQREKKTGEETPLGIDLMKFCQLNLPFILPLITSVLYIDTGVAQ